MTIQIHTKIVNKDIVQISVRGTKHKGKRVERREKECAKRLL